MVVPEMFLPNGGPIYLRCNVCERKVRAGIADLECVSGEKFETESFLMGSAVGSRNIARLESSITEHDGKLTEDTLEDL